MTSNDNYRYDKVTMSVLMRDFVFDKNAPKADDVIPAFELVDADGARVTNLDLFGGRPFRTTLNKFWDSRHVCR